MHASVYMLHYAYKRDKAIRNTKFEEKMSEKYDI